MSSSRDPSHPRRRRVRPLLASSLLMLASACSEFNMAPQCAETGPGLQRLLAGLSNDRSADMALVQHIISLRDIRETSSDYNQRDCSATVAAGDYSAAVLYRVRQSEGLQKWYDIEILNNQDSDVQILAGAAQALYANR